MFGNLGSFNMMWILVLLLVLGNGDCEGGASCDTLIWLLLLSRYCGGDCGCNSCPTRSSNGCGCGC